MKYFLISPDNALLLAGGQVPTALPQGVTRPADDLVFDMCDKVGFPAEAWQLPAEAAETLPEGSALVPLRETWAMLSKADYDAAARASAWVYWERTNRYCPICGTPLVRHMDMGKRCPSCRAEHFPHLAPASIVLVTRPTAPYQVDVSQLPLLQGGGEPQLRTFRSEALLVHARSFRNALRYGLVAGFLEGGETLEECAAREVREEAGITIVDVRYFGSQPWPYPSGVMVGFTARCAVDAQIRMDDGELSSAAFFRADRLPQIPDPMSIARQLIDAWLRGEVS